MTETTQTATHGVELTDVAIEMMSTTQSVSRSSHRSARLYLGSIAQVFQKVAQAYRVYRERQALLSLSDSALKDIGLSRADAYREASRPFWDIPENR